MRLWLASHRIGEDLDELLTMVGPGARVAVVSNAIDFIPAEARESYARTVHDPMAAFRDAGLDAYDLDLRRFFGRPGAIAAELARVGLVWAVGGNAFLLRRAMRQSGFDAVAPDLVRQDRLVYGGWSAGACVAGPHLRGLELMDDPAVLAPGYDPAPVWDGLGLVDICILPHFRSEHPESEAAEAAASFMQANGIAHRTLRDDETLIQNGGDLELRATRA
jgi:dipeptidase E